MKGTINPVESRDGSVGDQVRSQTKLSQIYTLLEKCKKESWELASHSLALRDQYLGQSSIDQGESEERPEPQGHLSSIQDQLNMIFDSIMSTRNHISDLERESQVKNK